MPKLGADMTAGTLVTWRKQPGDIVSRGDVLAEVDTDKGVIDIESFTDGVLETLLVQPGEKVPVGTALARIRGPGETAAPGGPLPASYAPPTTVQSSPVPAAAQQPAFSLSAEDLRRLRISPSARLRARELGVDPRTIQGTGRGGAITREDIERVVASRTTTSLAASAAVPQIRTSDAAERSLRMRQAIAAAMTRANREIPHYYLTTTIDMQAALRWLAGQNERRSVTDRLLYGVLLLKATALALREVPELNAFWQADQLQIQSSIHLGVAISLRGGGLIAPALHDADKQSLDELMRQLRDLSGRTRSGGLRSSELSDQTITVTSLGEQGVEAVYGVIYPPQVALVGFGKVVQRPWCVGDQIVARPLVTATLAGDHRATDGHRGGVLLAAIDRLLQEPEKL